MFCFLFRLRALLSRFTSVVLIFLASLTPLAATSHLPALLCLRFISAVSTLDPHAPKPALAAAR